MSKIYNIESKVENSISVILQKNNIEEDIFAIGVSGGADSLALIFLLNIWAKKCEKKLIALTVNHGLRQEAEEEAEYVASLMQKHNIEHHILTWQGDKPSTGIEEAARKARYGLIEDFCQDNRIRFLLTAHHKYDQAETFLMRLQRGSGVDGLSAMSEVAKLGGLTIIRPLLDIAPDELKSYLASKNIEWKEDKSNYSEDFLRVRIRNLLPILDAKMGLTVDRMVKTSKVLSRTRDYLEKQVQIFCKNNITFYTNNVAKIPTSLFCEQHEEMMFRIVSKMLKEISGKNYIPRADDVERVVSSIAENANMFKGRTLGGCEIINYDNALWFFPEVVDSYILTKKEWGEFVARNPYYKSLKLPYKVRKIIKSIEF